MLLLKVYWLSRATKLGKFSNITNLCARKNAAPSRIKEIIPSFGGGQPVIAMNG